MKQDFLYEMILDNFADGVYVLDDRGNYVFVNTAYVQMLNMSKEALLDYNVRNFLATGEINVCIADIVYREKRRVVMFQDVLDTQHRGRENLRLLVVSTPVFNREGHVQNIISVVRPMHVLEQLQHEASLSEPITRIIPTGASNEGGDIIIASSVVMREVLHMALTVAKVDSAILISGESGTGKEVVAKFIHKESARNTKPMIIVNCASLPANLLEAELFGYEKGAFTGATPGGKRGLFEEADGSTLFLDEINSLPFPLQGKLLRAIETKKIQRIGSNKWIDVDFRLLAATNENLEEMVAEKRFRSDLYYRLDVIPIELPPLRERREDIIPLAHHFLYYFCKKHNKKKTFTPRTLEAMRQYNWPGNVRQLKNFVERSVVVIIGDEIEVMDVESVADGKRMLGALKEPAWAAPGCASIPVPDFTLLEERKISLPEYLEQCERDYLAWALQKYGTTYQAAEALGTTQSLIMRRKKKYNM